MVIGASGQIGAELIEKLVELHGGDQVIATDIKPAVEFSIPEVMFFQLDVLDKENLYQIVKKHNVDEIYLLAALLSAVSENKIKSAWDLNMNGLFNVLDLARENHISKIFWPSSIAVFGITTPKFNTPQTTILEPLTVYGISKLSGERWCEYYNNKFGVDVRSLRYPGIISYKSKPGGGTTDYAVDVFHGAVKDGRYTSYLADDVILPMVYMDDAIRATMELMRAEETQLSIKSSYNISAMSFSPADIAKEIKKTIPDFSMNYAPDFRNDIALTWPSQIDDSKSRKEWNWKHKFDLNNTTELMLTEVKKQHKIKEII